MRNYFIVSIIILFITPNGLAQDKSYAKQIIEKLSSNDFKGRGYIDNGDIMTAQYITKEFKKHGVKSFTNDFLQPFEIAINTFPDALKVKIDDHQLRPGEDYYVGGGSPKTNGVFEIIKLDTAQLKDAKKLALHLNNKVVALPAIAERDSRTYDLNAAGYIFTHAKKMIWKLSDATTVKPYFYLRCKDSVMQNAKSMEVHINNIFLPNYKTANVIGMIEGAVQPDSFYVFTAHFDHLGQMGSDVIFPGANDNASGIAMLLDLARHMDKAKPAYSVIFMAFAAEECGLFGSEYAANHLPIAQEKIKFLFNLDMIGTGSGGIAMINATEVPKADSVIRLLNSEHNYFDNIKSAGPRCVSDHCAFARKGIPAIFIFTMGKEYMHYHTPSDKGPVPLTK